MGSNCSWLLATISPWEPLWSVRIPFFRVIVGLLQLGSTVTAAAAALLPTPCSVRVTFCGTIRNLPEKLGLQPASEVDWAAAVAARAARVASE